MGVEARGVSFAECVRQGEGEAWREGEAKKGVRKEAVAGGGELSILKKKKKRAA